MTLSVAHYGVLPDPYFWCDKHEPSDYAGITEKVPVHFDAIKLFEDKWGQRQICKRVRVACGIHKGTRITEDFAANFFASLS
jgi:hypothetical protein